MPAPGQHLTEPDLWQRLGDAIQPMYLEPKPKPVYRETVIERPSLLTPKPGELLGLTGVEPHGGASVSDLAIDAGLIEAKRLGLDLQRWQVERLLTASGVASIGPTPGR